ncbi:MAG: bifunctional DNA primase/polymerase [Propionibacteriaceae bacterium]
MTDTTTTSLAIPVITDDTAELEAGYAYANAGFYIGPCKRGSKNPGSVLGDDWHLKTSRDYQVITSWFAGTDHGLFLHMGRSGGVAIDVDDPDKLHPAIQQAISQYKPPYQSTRTNAPGRGHYVFAMPEGRRLGNSLGDLGKGWGEIRGVNGVIIAAPSKHKDPNGHYEFQRTGPVPILPGYVASRLPDAEDAAEGATDEEVEAFLNQYTNHQRPDLLNVHIAAWQKKTAAGESRHGTVMGHIAGAMKEVKAGLIDAKFAADTFEAIFVPAIMQQPNGSKQGKARNAAEAKNEWAGILAWAVAQGNASDPAKTRERVNEKVPPPFTETPKPQTAANPITLEEARATFKQWLGNDYDTDALDAMLAAAAVERLDGDPLWLLIISGSGNAKTETVQALNGIGAVVASTITSEGALLSATSKRERSKDATGGLLREIGDRGVLVIKDVTSILSMGRELRGQVLGALREIHDGSWVRKAGTDGGRSLPWSGRIAVIGAVTTKWDQAHDVIASMGDRFVLVRVDSTNGRVAAGRKAIGNTGVEAQMRADLAGAVAGVIAGMETTATVLTDEETDIVLAAADLVTLARTGVEYDYRGDVIDAHAPEMPTRFAKELTQIIQGAVAIGIPRHEALRLAIRCARDSMPPLRLTAIDDLAANPASTASDVRRRINKPWSTVDRQLQALHMLGVLDVDEATYGNEKTRWYYSLGPNINPKALDPKSSPETSVGAPSPKQERGRDSNKHSPITDISGEDGGGAPICWQCGKELWPDGSCSGCRPPRNLFSNEAVS